MGEGRIGKNWRERTMYLVSRKEGVKALQLVAEIPMKQGAES